VQRIDAQKGEAMITCTRNPGLPAAAGGSSSAGGAGVNGSGTILGLAVRAVAPGQSKIQITEVRAQGSLQQAIAVATGEAIVRVQ
jgi:class 3 adenylate cyclase